MATSPSVAGPKPCKITALASGGFQAKAADMPVDCELAAPDGKTEILKVAVHRASDDSTVTGQPTNQSGTSFTLNLPAGGYAIYIVVGCLSSAKPVWIVESCGGQTKLDWIAVPSNTAGNFPLQVV